MANVNHVKRVEVFVLGLVELRLLYPWRISLAVLVLDIPCDYVCSRQFAIELEVLILIPSREMLDVRIVFVCSGSDYC